MMWWILLAVAATLLVPVAYWQRNVAEEKARQIAREQELAQRQQDSQKLKEIVFRKHGERGLSSAVYGDIMCADGVYLPQVWESGFSASIDGRWIRIASFGQASAYLVDRKNRCSWTLNAEEAEMLETMHWRLPRWSGHETHPSALQENNQGSLSEAVFDVWLGKNVANSAAPLTALRDLWVPWDSVPVETEAEPPLLPQPPMEGALVAVQRYWPDSLRTELRPLEIYTHPQWQLMFDGEPQPWIVALEMPFVWRKDGQALAMYAYPMGQGGRRQVQTLAVWEAGRGWQKYSDMQPADRKNWMLAPLKEREDGKRGLRWAQGNLVQEVRIDTPVLQRPRNGTRIQCRTGKEMMAAFRQSDGRLMQRPAPVTTLSWERDLKSPDKWVAFGASVAGAPLRWNLALNSNEVASGMPAYRLHWGETPLSGLWELEHVVVRERWVILLRHPQDDGLEEGTQVYVWDGRELLPVDLPWRVERIMPVPGKGDLPGFRVALLAIAATVDEDAADMRTGIWRWPLHKVTPERLELAGNAMVYEVRHIVPDSQGVWRLLPSWRPISSTLHPCADGDYLWTGNVSDELWWSGGIRQYTPERPEEDPQVPRGDGFSVTRSGIVLCGSGPTSMPHPNGEGWLVLQCPERPAHGALTTWLLHWLQPHNRQIRTLRLQAAMPILEGWDNRGVYWREDVPSSLAGAPAPESNNEAPTPEEIEALAQAGADSSSAAVSVQRPPIQTVDPQLWQRAEIHDLKQGPYGLWLRKQDMGHADVVRKNPDWPWSGR